MKAFLSGTTYFLLVCVLKVTMMFDLNGVQSFVSCFPEARSVPGIVLLHPEIDSSNIEPALYNLLNSDGREGLGSRPPARNAKWT
jgi:hypothetical protein